MSLKYGKQTLEEASYVYIFMVFPPIFTFDIGDALKLIGKSSANSNIQ